MTTRRLPQGLRQRAAARHRARVIEACRPLRERLGYTLADCCDHLNATGMRTFTGLEWKVGHLARVLPPWWSERARFVRRYGPGITW